MLNEAGKAEGGYSVEMIRQLSLVKGEERFVFRYLPGHEAEIIDCFADLAANQESRFDWFDAAVLSYQMGRRIETELETLAKTSGIADQ